MEEEVIIEVEDIANELLIVNKHTIDKLFTLDDCANCIALYMFYYKTAKWQKTNKIKATDKYTMSCLKWGKDRLSSVKHKLQECGLIETLLVRNEGKIQGWYIKLHYIVTKEKVEDVKILVENVKEYSQPEVDAPTSGSQDTNALREKTNSLKIEKEVLKDNIKKQSKEEIDAIRIFYNQHCGEMPKANTLSPNREAFIRARLAEYGEDDVKKVILLAENNDFLQGICGYNGKTNEWKASLEWLMRPNNFPKVLDGYYSKFQKEEEEEDDGWGVPSYAIRNQKKED